MDHSFDRLCIEGHSLKPIISKKKKFLWKMITYSDDIDRQEQGLEGLDVVLSNSSLLMLL